jgi:FtsP/CotA-like multicopper oxidase with cupredoxin domain
MIPTSTKLGLASAALSVAALTPFVASRRQAAPSPSRGLPVALPNDHRVGAGRQLNGTLTLQLEAQEVLWYPEDTAGPGIPVFGFVESGRPATTPGPMIRVAAGTNVHVTVRNRLAVPLRLRGLQEHMGTPLDSVMLAAGETRHLQFRVDSVGTFLYWGRTEPVPATPDPGFGRDAMLAGAFIVDPAGVSPPRERVLFISGWGDTLAALGTKSAAAERALRPEFTTFARDRWFAFVVNGRSWPHTERLSYTVGDTIAWRVINGSAFPHPMHLHGFYFDVHARGDARRDTLFAPIQRRQAVTEWIPRATTMQLQWVAARPGNWVYHCHLVTHITETLRLGEAAAPRTGHAHAEDGMAGLVMGIRVAPRSNSALVADAAARHRLRVFVTERANTYGDQPGYSYVLQEGPTAPARDSLRLPGSTLVLRQNEPTEIAVLNATRVATAVHWHGVELESFYDGVSGWSGWGARLAPIIAPGDSFVVRLTPVRPGTFIYHTHINEAVQLASGLYGPLIVLPERALPDTTDRVVLTSVNGPLDESRVVVNGTTIPRLIELRAGIPHRLRLIGITPLGSASVQLLTRGERAEWRALAKDGAELPGRQATRAAALDLHPGETYDFEVLRQRPESLTLQVTTPASVSARIAARARGAAVPRDTILVAVLVR